MSDDEAPRAYETPAAVWFVPLPNPQKPMLGGAFLVIETRDGEKTQVALTLRMVLQLGQAYTALVERLVTTTIHLLKPVETYGTTSVPLTPENVDKEIEAMLADLDAPADAIDHSEKENDSE